MEWEKEAMVRVAEQELETGEAARAASKEPGESVGWAVAAMGQPQYAIREPPQNPSAQ